MGETWIEAWEKTQTSLPDFPVPPRHLVKWNRRVKAWRERMTGDRFIAYSVRYSQDPVPEHIPIPPIDEKRAFVTAVELPESGEGEIWSSPFITRRDFIVLHENEALEVWVRKHKEFAERIRKGDLPIVNQGQTPYDAHLSAMIAKRDA